MKTPRYLLTALLAVSVLTVTAFAADLSGKWKWISTTKAGGPSDVIADLVLKGGVVTGTVTTRQGPATITDGSLQGTVVAFTVTRSSGASTAVLKYSGQLAADTITGTVERTSSDTPAPAKKDWFATRVH